MKKEPYNENRRDFIKSIIPASALICIGCPSALSIGAPIKHDQEQDFDTKIKNELSMTWEEYFNKRYNGQIGLMKTFARHIGKDEVITILKERADRGNASRSPNAEAKSVKDFLRPIEESDQYQNCLEYKYIELTDKVCEIRIVNCLYAKTFRSRNAGDFGYASICHGDFSGATAFHPKLRLERTKTLMQGHDSCNHRYIWEG